MYDENNNSFDALQPYDPIGMQPAGTDWGRVAGIGLCVAGAAVCSVAVYKALFPSEAEIDRQKKQDDLIDRQIAKARVEVSRSQTALDIEQANLRKANAEATLAEREVLALPQSSITAMKQYNLKVAESQAVAAAATIKTKMDELSNVDETMTMVKALLAGNGAAALEAQKSAQQPSKEDAAMQKAVEAYIAAMR